MLERISGPHEPGSPFGNDPYRTKRGRKSINLETKDDDFGCPLES